MRMLEEEPDLALRVPDVAHRVGLSLFHFSRLFTDQIGVSAAAYARNIRLDHAACRLLYYRAPIDEIARSAGYTNRSAFNRAFRSHFEMSPGALDRRFAGILQANHVPDLDVESVVRPARKLLARRFLGLPTRSMWCDFEEHLPDKTSQDVQRIGLLHDDPAVTPPAVCRYDCCVAWPSDAGAFDVPADDGFDEISLTAGRWIIASTVGKVATVASVGASLMTSLPTRSSDRQHGFPWMQSFGSSPASGDTRPFDVAIRI